MCVSVNKMKEDRSINVLPNMSWQLIMGVAKKVYSINRLCRVAVNVWTLVEIPVTNLLTITKRAF